MVLGDESAFFIVVLEHREVGNPRYRIDALGYHSELPRKLEPQGSYRGQSTLLVGIGNRKQNVALLYSRNRDYLFNRFGRELIRVAAPDRTVGSQSVPHKSFSLVSLYAFRKLIEFLTADFLLPAFKKNALDSSAGFRIRIEGREPASSHGVGHIENLHSETKVGLVASESRHCVGIGHLCKRMRKVYALYLPEKPQNKPFRHIHNVVFAFHETHLYIHLSEFGLTIGSEVLVAEAFHYLIISVRSAYHKQLLIKLRRLRKSVITTRMNAARDKIVPRAFGSGLPEEGRFHLDKSVLRKIRPYRMRRLRPHKKIPLHLSSTKIEISVLQPKKLARSRIPYNERKSIRFGKNSQFVGNYFYLARLHIGIDVIPYSAPDLASYRKNVFHLYSRSLLKKLLVGQIHVENDLHYSRPVPKLYENQPSEIPSTVSPAHNRYFSARIGSAKFPAHIRAFHSFQKFCHIPSPCGGFLRLRRARLLRRGQKSARRYYNLFAFILYARNQNLIVFLLLFGRDYTDGYDLTESFVVSPRLGKTPPREIFSFHQTTITSFSFSLVSFSISSICLFMLLSTSFS